MSVRIRPVAQTGTEIPIGVSEEYDSLPKTVDQWMNWCQDCDKPFIESWRIMPDGVRIIACFCSNCRSKRRMKLAAPLPRAWVHKCRR